MNPTTSKRRRLEIEVQQFMDQRSSEERPTTEMNPRTDTVIEGNELAPVEEEQDFEDEEQTGPVEVPIDSSEMRKQWRELSENLLLIVQCSNSLFLHTPTEIAVGALRLSLALQMRKQQTQSAVRGIFPYQALSEIFDRYLNERFGAEVAEAFFKVTQDVEKLIDYVHQAESNNVVFQSMKERIKKMSKYTTKKN